MDKLKRTITTSISLEPVNKNNSNLPTSNNSNNSDNFNTTAIVHPYRPTTSGSVNGVGSDLGVKDDGSILYIGIIINTCLILFPLIIACTCCLRKKCERSGIYNHGGEIPVEWQYDTGGNVDARLQRRVDSIRREFRNSSRVVDHQQIDMSQAQPQPIEDADLYLQQSQQISSTHFQNNQYLMQSIKSCPKPSSESEHDLGPIFTMPMEQYQTKMQYSSDVPEVPLQPYHDLSRSCNTRCKFSSPYCEQLQEVLIRETSLDFQYERKQT